MKHIFLSYTSSDKGRIGPLVALLEAHGRTVWWDRKIPAGKEFSEVIEKAIKEARCVVVVWSRDSVKSPWVKIEAAEGVHRGILVPVLIDDDIEIPLEFRRIQAAKLLDLAGGAREDDPEILNLLASVSETLERGSRGSETPSGIMAAVQLEKKRIAESDDHGDSRTGPASDRRARRPLPSRRTAFALGLGLLLLVGGFALVRFLLPDPDPGPEQVFSGRVTFIGVEADSEDSKADKKLIDYLKSKAASDPPLTFSPELYGYEVVVEKLAGWSPEDGPFLARATPYVYVAAKMLGADLEVLATYHSRATGKTTYRSYFVVERSRFPNGPPTLDELVSFLKTERRTFIYHSRFSTSSYFLPSLFFREHKIFHMDRPTGALAPIDAKEIAEASSTELVELVAQGTADLAAVWDGTKVKFEAGDPANVELGKKVYFIPIDTELPNDLLVCSSFLPTAVKGEIRRALGEMKEMKGEPLIDVGDFLWWEDFKHATGAPEALARLGWAAAKSAIKAPAPVTVDVQQVEDAERQVPASYLEAARQAIRLSGTEFEVYDPEYHQRADFIWRLALDHDGTVLLTSRIKGLSDDERTDRAGAVPPQQHWISFADEAELTGRISAFIHSRIHRIRYLWPYQPNRPTLIRDVVFSLSSGTPVIAQQVVWEDPERNKIQQRGAVEARIDAFDTHKITLETEDFRTAQGGFQVDPLSNQAYRVILARDSGGSAVLASLSYLFVAVLVLAAAGAVVDLRRSRRAVPVAAAPRLRLIGSEGGPERERTGEAASARLAEAR